MSFAVIETGGKQYKVSASNILKVEKLNIQKGGKVEFKKVLLLNDDKTTEVGFALEGLTSRGAKGEIYMRETDHQIHFDMVLSHVSENVEKTFIYNDEDYGMAYITDGWVSREDITLPTTCKMKRPKKS